MRKALVFVILFTLISRVSGFVRELTLAYFYGASSVSDAFIISSSIPTVIFSFVGAAIGAGFIPVYTKMNRSNEVNAANKFTSNIVNIAIIFSLVVSTFVLLFPTFTISLFASGFDNQTLALSVTFTKIMIFTTIASVVTSVISAYLRVNSKFVLVSMIGVVVNLGTIISIILSSKYNLLWLPIGYTMSMYLQLIILFPSIKKRGYKYSLQINLKSEGIKLFMTLIIPIIIGVAIHDLNTIIDKTIVSNASIGGVSSLNYASRVNSLMQGIIVLSITTIIFPILSRYIQDKNTHGFKKLAIKSINYTIIILLPISIFMFTNSKEVIEFLFMRGEFDIEAVLVTASALKYYSIGLISLGLIDILNRMFYSNHDMKTPMIISSITLVINLLLSLFFFFTLKMGVGGVSLATSISSTIMVLILLIVFNKRIINIQLEMILLLFTKVFIASILSLFIIYVVPDVNFSFLFPQLSSVHERMFNLLTQGLFFIVSYSVFIGIADINEVTEAKKHLIKSIFRKKGK